MGAGEGSASGSSPGVKPGAVTALLKELAQTPGEPGEALPAVHPGQVVGRFELLREIGRGGFGQVYEARDRELGRNVAFKALRARSKLDLGEERLLREAEAAARLSHPNIVTLYDVGRCEQGPYLVLELLEGRTLAERRAQGTLSLREALRVAIEVAKGVAHAHAHGVVHRDLTPGNVFLCDDGQVKVLDFGMAHAFGQRKVDGGTRAYMAPEQARGAPEDERTDVFALGVILHEMLAGEFPYPDAEALSSSSPASELEVPEAPALGELVGRMLEKDPVKRPRDVGEVLSALTAFQRELERLPSRGSAQVRTRRPSSGFRDLFAELERRRVMRVLLGYAIVSFAILQIAEPVLHGLHLPDSTLSIIVVLLGIGFPVAVALGWVFDLTAGGVATTPERKGTGLRDPRLVLLLVGLGGLAGAPGLAWYFLRQRSTPPAGGKADVVQAAPGSPSVAVLPFADMSPQKDQEYFADGIAEEILNALTHVEGLQVAGRTSSFSFKGKADDLRAIAQRLTVGAVLEGSVRKAGNRIRVTAQLIDAANGYHLWSETYDRELSDIFAVQDEIAAAVVSALKVKLLPGRAPTTYRAATPDAYTHYLLGRQFYNRHTVDGFRRAREEFERALALDPEYAPAQAWLSMALRDQANHGASGAEESAEIRRRAGAAAEKAVRLAPQLADAYSARGLLRMAWARDWSGAQADLARAVTRNPRDSPSHRRLGLVMAAQGRLDEAIASLRKATEVEPLDATSWSWLGMLEAGADRLDLARAAVLRALEISPEGEELHSALSDIYVLEGKPAAALAESRLAREDDRLRITAMAEHDLGHATQSRQAVEDLATRYGHAQAESIAQVYAWRGDRARAFEWLERALGQEIWGVKFDPFLRKLHGDPRWTNFLRKMNLPVD